MKNLNKVLYLALGVLALVIACQSKVVEKSPEELNIRTGVTLDPKESEKINQTLQKAEDILNRVRNISVLVRKALEKEPSESITPFDLLAGIVSELQETQDKKIADKYIRESQNLLEIQGIPAECKKIETRLETEEVPTNTSLSFFVKSCGTNGKFEKLAIFKTENSQVTLSIQSQVLERVLGNTLKKAINGGSESKCQVGEINQSELNLSCENILAAVWGTSTLTVDSLLVDTQSNPSTIANIRFEEKNKSKVRAKVTLSKENGVKVEFQAPSENEAQP